MAKEIICVYQDCPLCGDRGKQLKKIILDKKLNVRKVSFASEEGKELIHEAVFNQGIGTMPFFTDGEKFATSIEEIGIVEKPVEKRYMDILEIAEVETDPAPIPEIEHLKEVGVKHLDIISEENIGGESKSVKTPVLTEKPKNVKTGKKKSTKKKKKGAKK